MENQVKQEPRQRIFSGIQPTGTLTLETPKSAARAVNGDGR